jgi:drug/metabolite transporter (DMT)-like permease
MPATVALSKPRLHPYLGLTVGVLAVSAASLIITAAQKLGVPSLVIAAYRLTVASLVLAPVAVTRHRAELARLTRRDLAWAGLTGLLLGLHFATWITSLEYTSIASSAVLVSTAPIFVALFSLLVWRERLGAAVAAGLLLTVVGAAIVGLADVCGLSPAGLACPPIGAFLAGRAFVGDLLALAGAMAFAGNMLIGGRLRAKLSLVPYITLGYSAAALTLFAAVLAARLPVTGYPAPAYLWLALLALAPQLIGHSSLNWALRYLSTTFVSVAVLGEPIGSTVLAYLILQQTPTAFKLAGGAVILTGILTASRGSA